METIEDAHVEQPHHITWKKIIQQLMSQQINSTQLLHNVTLYVSQKGFIIWYQQQPYIATLQVQDTGYHEKPNNTTLYVVGERSHMERTGYGEQLMYMQHSSSQGRRIPTVLPLTLKSLPSF